MKYCFDLNSKQEGTVWCKELNGNYSVSFPNTKRIFEIEPKDLIFNILEEEISLKYARREDLNYGKRFFIKADNHIFSDKIRKMAREETNVEYNRYLNQIIALIRNDMLFIEE